jgi:hypothetical protein
MAVQNFSAATSSGTPSSSSGSSGSSPTGAAKSTSHVGAIAGGVLGGLVVIGLLCGLALFFLRRKKNAAKGLNGNGSALPELSGQQSEKHEMPGSGTVEMSGGTVDRKYMALSQQNPSLPQYELAGNEGPRHELS